MSADLRKTLIACGLSAAYLISLWASLSITRYLGVPPFWPCNAFIAAAVVLLDRRRLWPVVVGCSLASYPLFLAASRGWDIGVLRVVFNVGEGLVAGGLARWALGPRRLLRTSVDFLKLQCFAILPAVGLNWLCRESSLRIMDPTAVDAWRSAYLPHVLGLATVMPAMLLLAQRTPAEMKRSRLETTASLALLGVAYAILFNSGRAPVAVILGPALLLIGFRLGPRGAVLSNLLVGLIALPGTLTGSGAWKLHPQWSLHERALIYQVLFLATLVCVTLCAFVVAEQMRLRRLLVRRAAAAREARRRALEASRSKTEFLATMSHEIRTPMNSILGFTQLLMHNEGVSKEAREQLKVVAEAGASLMTVLNDILDFSKVEAGQIDLHEEALDMAAVAGAALDIMREPARAKGLKLRLESEGIEGLHIGDSQRLRQVLLNLLNNAVKFTDEGHVLLRAAADAPRGVLRFEISDSGIGIEPQVIERLFTRFSQADSSTTRHYGGSGLGLAICKGLVERMGGSIGVDSRPGAGSCFWFEIPAVPALAPASQVGAGPLGAPRLTGCVLLVDDHPMNRRLGETLLSMLGCETHMASSGEEAVQAAAQYDYDAILMDVHMPRMDGLAATRAIRASGPAGARVPIIAMSADVMPQNLARCRQAGMVDHVAKPVQLQALHEVLSRWIDGQKRRSAA